MCQEIAQLHAIHPSLTITRTASSKSGEHVRQTLNDTEFTNNHAPEDYCLINGVGMVPGKNRELRQRIFRKYKELGFDFITLVHPSAILSHSVSLGEGAQLMAGCIIQCNTSIGEDVIVNTGASIDHDCSVEQHSHIAPGVVLCGDVSVGRSSFIGAGAVILPQQKLGSHTTIAAGFVQRPEL